MPGGRVAAGVPAASPAKEGFVGAHAAMDGLIALQCAHRFDEADVEEIHCGLSHKALDLVGLPIERKRVVASTVEGQFSMPFLAIVALLEKGMGWDSYRRQLKSAAVQAGMRKVSVGHDDAVEALFPARFAASVRVRLLDGRVLETFVPSPRGEPENFVTLDQLGRKFSDLVIPYLGERTAALFDRIVDIGNSDIPALMASTRPVAKDSGSQPGKG